MKKIALFLLLSMLLTGCGSKEVPGTVSAEKHPETVPVLETEVLEETAESVPETEATAPADPKPSGGKTPTVKNTYTANDKNLAPKYALPEGFQEKEETVYAVKATNLRQYASSQSSCPGKLEPGDKVLRIGTRTDGWSALYYNDRVAYVMSKYLSSEPPRIQPTQPAETSKPETEPQKPNK